MYFNMDLDRNESSNWLLPIFENHPGVFEVEMTARTEDVFAH